MAAPPFPEVDTAGISAMGFSDGQPEILLFFQERQLDDSASSNRPIYPRHVSGTIPP